MTVTQLPTAASPPPDQDLVRALFLNLIERLIANGAVNAVVFYEDVAGDVDTDATDDLTMPHGCGVVMLGLAKWKDRVAKECGVDADE